AAGESIRAHEFHYYGSADNGSAFLATKASSGKRYACSHASATLYVGFPHLYFPANPAFAANFVKKAAQYARV
ncbi:MAG TPA: cobyrinate a,c-diamide synthase, partial [Clostridia bacterium]|nr:cobyrinate a,c-diamide synthase [Clostridia bacterium]